MNKIEETIPRKIGFTYTPPPPGGFRDRLHAELHNPEDAARLRWLGLLFYLVYWLCKNDWSLHIQRVWEHPILAALTAVAIILFLPILEILPLNLIRCETRLFEAIRKPTCVIFGRNAVASFIVTLAFELALTGFILRSARIHDIHKPLQTVARASSITVLTETKAVDTIAKPHPGGTVNARINRRR